MSIVKIPTSHFVTSAKRQYSDIDTAIVREAIQNSVDAGATEIAIKTNSESITVIDNGCGMSEQLLIDAMLTMSGTFKNSGDAIGGFGAAKEILLFQHASYEIHTQDNFVVGNVLEYNLTKKDYFQGTSIYMKFHSSYGYDEITFVAKAKEWLGKCDIKADITINGDRVPANKITNIVRNLKWGNVYCDDTVTTQDRMFIRIKGVCMFSHYIGKINKNISIEITKPSTEVLTSSRDHFQWDQLQEVQKLIEEITIDKASFGVLHKTMTRFSGNPRSFINRVIYAVMKDILSVENDFNKENIVLAKQNLESIREQVQNGTMVKEDAISKIKDIAINFPVESCGKIDNYINSVDFYIQVNDKGYDRIPDEISPSTKMRAKYRKMACLWKACLHHVFKSNNLEASYCIGWVVDESVQATYTRNDGIEKILLNPYFFGKLNFKNKKEMVYNMLLTAAHEVAHRECQYHDEHFVSYYENILNKSISALASYRTLLNAARLEII